MGQSAEEQKNVIRNLSMIFSLVLKYSYNILWF